MHEEKKTQKQTYTNKERKTQIQKIRPKSNQSHSIDQNKDNIQTRHNLSIDQHIWREATKQHKQNKDETCMQRRKSKNELWLTTMMNGTGHKPERDIATKKAEKWEDDNFNSLTPYI